MYIQGEDVIKSSGTKGDRCGVSLWGPLIYHLLSWTDTKLSSPSLSFKSYLIFLCLFEGSWSLYSIPSQVWTMKGKKSPPIIRRKRGRKPSNGKSPSPGISMLILSRSIPARSKYFWVVQNILGPIRSCRGDTDFVFPCSAEESSSRHR